MSGHPAPSAAGYPELALLVGGEWRSPAEGMPVFDPATGAVLGQLPKAGARDLEQAVAAAARGFETWRRTAPAARCRIMLEAVRLLRARRERLATVMTLEQGKPLDQSLVEVERACAILEWDANEGLRAYGRVIPAAPGMTHMVLRRPVGPVAAFAPWNFPASAPARKIGGALAAGCSIILKPFGGIKDSGYGREGGTEGLDGYMITRLVSVATA